MVAGSVFIWVSPTLYQGNTACIGSRRMRFVLSLPQSAHVLQVARAFKWRRQKPAVQVCVCIMRARATTLAAADGRMSTLIFGLRQARPAVVQSKAAHCCERLPRPKHLCVPRFRCCRCALWLDYC